MANLTWLNNRAEMYAYLNDTCGVYNTPAEAQMMYSMTHEQLQQACVEHGDASVSKTLQITDTAIQA